MTNSKTSIGCKLVVGDEIIYQEEKFKYLGIDISGYGDVEREVRDQTPRAMRGAAHLNGAICGTSTYGSKQKLESIKQQLDPY